MFFVLEDANGNEEMDKSAMISTASYCIAGQVLKPSLFMRRLLFKRYSYILATLISFVWIFTFIKPLLKVEFQSFIEIYESNSRILQSFNPLVIYCIFWLCYLILLLTALFWFFLSIYYLFHPESCAGCTRPKAL